MSKEKKWWVGFIIAVAFLGASIDSGAVGSSIAAGIVIITLVVVAINTWT